MSHIWRFSASSETALRRCIDAAGPPNDENKWFRAFGKKYSKTENFEENPDLNNVSNNREDDIVILDATDQDVPVISPKIEDNFFNLLEAEPISHFDNLVEECVKDQDLITTVAQRLSSASVEKICDHFFNMKDINLAFLEIFYQKFFPAVLKRECTWFSLDLLVKSNKAYPLQFKKLLHLLLKDLEIPNKVLNDFVQTLDENTKLSFVNNLIEIELNTEEFSHNLQTICTVYKYCRKTENIQSYVLHHLIQHATECANEKNYGRLLLSFLQAQKNIGPLQDYTKIEKVIESHRTPFKKPSMSVFKEFLDKYNT